MIVPEDSLIVTAGYLYEAFDGIKAIAEGVRQENDRAVTVALYYTMTKLTAIEQLLVAILGEQPEVTRGRM